MYLYPTFKKNMDNTVGMIIHIYYNLLQKFFESANSSCEKEMIRTHTNNTIFRFSIATTCSVYSSLLFIFQTFPTHLVRMLSMESHLSRLTPFFGDLTQIVPLQRKLPHSTCTEVISLTRGALLSLVTYALILLVSVLSSLLWAISMPFLYT